MKNLFITVAFVFLFMSTSYLQPIIGGQQPDPEQFPWVTSLTMSGSDMPGCGASLIDPYWVLTAGHCVVEFPGFPEVEGCIINSLHLDQENFEPHSEWIEVEAIISHENFDLFSGGADDIALIRLKEPAITTPVKLGLKADSSLYAADMPGIVLGWGLTSSSGSGSDTLLYADTYFQDNVECAMAAPMFASSVNEGNAICAGFGPNGEIGGAASGDSGGPLVYLDNTGEYRQIGIVSGGETDATTEDSPGVFTKVTSYAAWIDSVMINYSPELSSTTDIAKQNLTFKYIPNIYVSIQGLNQNRNYSITVVNNGGQPIKKMIIKNSNQVQVGVQGLHQGLYVIQVIDRDMGHLFTKKVIITN